MTRLLCGGTPGDVATAVTDLTRVVGSTTGVRYSLIVPGQTFRVFQNQTGAPRLTDLLLDADGSAIATVTADDSGQLPAFRLPDGLRVDGVWMDPDDSSTQRFFLPARQGPATQDGTYALAAPPAGTPDGYVEQSVGGVRTWSAQTNVAAAVASAIADGSLAPGMKKAALTNAGALVVGGADVVNWHPNPGAEYGTTGLTAAGSNATVVQSTDWASSGTKSWKITNASNNTSASLSSVKTPTVACSGASATAVVKVKNGSTGTRLIRAQLVYLDASNAQTGFVTQDITLASGATGTITFQHTTTSWATTTQFFVQVLRYTGGDGPAAGDVFYLDDWFLAPGYINPLPALPLNGDLSRTYWDGTAGNSKSVRVAPAPTAQQIAVIADSLTKSSTLMVALEGESTVSGGSNGVSAAQRFTTATGKTTYNGGLSGATSGVIAILHGIATVTTTAAFTMPTDTTPVTGIPLQASIAPCNIRQNAGTASTVHGSFGGRAGNLLFTGTSNAAGTSTATFTPDGAGAGGTIASGTAFVPDTPQHDTWFHILQAFTNDCAFSAPNHALGAVAVTRALEAKLSAAVAIPRYFVVPAFTAPTVGPGGAGSANDPSGTYANAIAVRDALVAAFPTRVVDVRGYLASAQALTDANAYCVATNQLYDFTTDLLRAPTGGEVAGFTPTSTDLANVAAGMTPPSLMFQLSVHPNDLGKALYAIKVYQAQMSLRGY